MRSGQNKSSSEKELGSGFRNELYEFRAFLKMELGRSANTVSAYMSDAEQFAHFLESRGASSFRGADADSIVAWVRGISKVDKASTQSRKLSAVKSLAGFLVDEKIWDKNYCDLVMRPKYRRNVPEVLSADEVSRLLESPSADTPEGLRDRAMLELMYSSGLRVSELCGLKESDIDASERIIRITGKGAKTRLVPVGEYALSAIADYKAVRRRILGDFRDADELFVTKRGGKMSRKTFWFNIKKYARSVGIEKNVKPHILRHSFATHLLRNGANLMSIREMLGHSDLATTQIYTALMTDEIYSQHAKKHPRSKMDIAGDGDF